MASNAAASAVDGCYCDGDGPLLTRLHPGARASHLVPAAMRSSFSAGTQYSLICSRPFTVHSLCPLVLLTMCLHSNKHVRSVYVVASG